MGVSGQTRRFLGFASFASLIAFSASAFANTPSTETIQLRVVTYNVWGLPTVLTPKKRVRLQTIADRVVELAPDVLVLQEVWFQDDAEFLIGALEPAGMKHTHRFESWGFGSGLLVLSRYPLTSTEFREFSDGKRVPWNPLHVDWAARKGVGTVRVETPLGPVDLAGTHLQAAYGTQDYLAVQLGQVVEAADHLKQFNLRKGEPRPPLVVAGDLNAAFDALPFKTLRSRLGLSEAAPKQGIDAILYRSGERLSVRIKQWRELFKDAVQLADGSQGRMSDHPAILADLELIPGVDTITSAGPEPQWNGLGPGAMEELSQWMQARQTRVSQTRGGALAFGFVGFLGLFGLRRRRWSRRFVVTAVLLGGLWCSYLGWVHGPTEIEAVARFSGSLDS